jgi:hypothetical protein
MALERTACNYVNVLYLRINYGEMSVGKGFSKSENPKRSFQNIP